VSAVRWSDRALAELERIHEYIAEDDPLAAARWVGVLQAAAGRLALFPRSGRVVPELDRDDVREIVKGNYRLVYLVTDHGPIVVTVFEAHQQFPESL
jgi:plasmid stabilization system protein ParE